MIRSAALKTALLLFALLIASCAARIKPLDVDSLPEEDELSRIKPLDVVDSLPEDEEFWSARNLQMSMPDDICIDFQLSFEFFPEIQNGLIVPGDRVQAGSYISEEYFDAFGILMSSTGGPQPYPRVFDSSRPSPKDLDLGTPHEDFGGPGRGAGGRRGSPGENAVPLGNVLIVQETDLRETEGSNEPNDKRGGGTITFDFTKPVRYVEDVGVLDIEPWDGQTYIEVVYSLGEFGGGEEQFAKIGVDGTGNNGVQTVPINLPYVRRMTVVFGTSGAITFVNFCADVVRVGFTDISNESYGPGPDISNQGYGLEPSYAATSGEGSKGSKNYRQLNEADAVSTKISKGRMLSTNKMSRHYTRGGQMNPST